MRQQVEFRLREAMEKCQISRTDLARLLHTNPDQISRLKSGSWTDITHEQVRRILLWAAKNEVDDLFSIVPHPVWSTFPGSDVSIFIGSGVGGDGDVQEPDANASNELIRFLKEDGCRTFVHPQGLLNEGEKKADEFVARIQSSMKTRNCIFVGGPRQSPATEVAVSSLWASTPFERPDRGGEKIPFEFIYPSWPEGKAASSFASVAAGTKEIKLTAAVTRRLKVPFLPREDWTLRKGLGWDFGLGVVCRKPLETEMNVTTIVLAGLGGLATWATTCGLTWDSIYIPTDEIVDHRPVARVLCARFLKKAGIDNRTWLPESSRWVGPPWKAWPPKLSK